MATRLNLIVMFLSLLLPLGAQTSRYITAGRMLGPTVFSPEGLIFATSEDQRLHYLDASGRLQASYQFTHRLAGPAVHGNGTWLALATTDRRLHRLNYTRPSATQGGSLSLLWSVTLPARVASAPALLPGGRILFLLTDGQLRAWENDGGLVWSRSLTNQAEKGLLNLDSNGDIWCIVHTRLYRLDARGQLLGQIDLPDTIQQSLLDQLGRLWLLTTSGRLWRLGRGGIGLSPLNYQNVIAMVGGQESIWLLTPQGAIVLNANDRVQKRLSTTKRLTPQVVLSAENQLAVVVQNGGLLFLSDQEETFIPSVVLEQLSLSPKGLVVGAGRDWSLYWWEWQQPPKLGWYQLNGNWDGSYRVNRPLETTAQRERWEGFNGFRIARLLLERGSRDDVESVLQNLENANKEELLDTIPYAPGLLLEICQNGLDRLKVENFQIMNNWPDLRLRAAKLLIRFVDWEMRSSINNLLRLENDVQVQLQYLKLLEQLSWDEDGATATVLMEVIRRNPDAQLAEAALNYLLKLRQAGSPLSHRTHRNLLQTLMNGPYPRSLRERVWQAIRS